MDDTRLQRIRDFIQPLRVTPGSDIVLGRDFDPADTGTFFTEEDSKGLLDQGVELLDHYQSRLAAQDDYGVLVVLQALDAGGKDSTIRHVMSGVNPQGVVVHGFRAPSADELDHDYLWRYAQKLPARGQIAIFNRSHYEEVVVVRVHPEILERQKLPAYARDEGVWERRYRQINDWERFLVENGFPVVKLFLNLSKEEQRRRFLRRIDYPKKNWKFNANDVKERAHWDEYQQAFSEMLTATSTEHAPWYVIPADHKWFMRVAVAAVLVNTMDKIDPQYPTVSEEALQALATSKTALEAEAPEGAPTDPIAAELAAAGTKE
ncbi:MAG TPA: polyphosphate kinase 2 family protein [Gaiellaceae bacterium]|jgi:PPK2 family polyphosphate:nucleotide phosphotransferase